MEEKVKRTDTEEVVIDTNSNSNTAGNIKISADVVSTIAGIAAEEIDGVAGMYSGFATELAEKLGGRKNLTKGVRIDMKDDTVSVDLYIIIKFGARIQEIAWRIQENVKNNIETMTGLHVTGVNLHIEGVSFDISEKDKTDDLPDEVIEVDSPKDEYDNEYSIDEE